jgi:hypothetical protein
MPRSYCSACGHVVSTFNELASTVFKKTMSSDKKMKVNMTPIMSTRFV